MDDDPYPYELEFWTDDHGQEPCFDWIKSDLSKTKRRAIGRAMRRVLQVHGINVVGERSWGRQLGGGLFEFRLDRKIDGESMVLRVFCHAYGKKKILALHGYDKGEDPSDHRQQQEIAEARQRLTSWSEANAREKKRAKKSGTKSGASKQRRKR